MPRPPPGGGHYCLPLCGGPAEDQPVPTVVRCRERRQDVAPNARALSMSIRNGTSGSGRCEGDHHRIGGEAIGRFDWGHSIRASSRPPAFSVAHQVQIRPSLCCRQEVALPSSRGLDERPAPHGDRSMANAGWRRRHTPRDPEHQPLRARPLRTSDRRCHDRRGRRSPLAVASLADIIRSREVADRPKDRDALQQLRAIERLYEHHETDPEPPDLGYDL